MITLFLASIPSQEVI